MSSTFDTATHHARLAVLRLQREQGRNTWTKGDYVLLAAMVAAQCGSEIDTDDCEIEKRAFRQQFGRVA
jgi:hypothetical protein